VAEAQATSQLEHPGIPPVHDIGIAPSGQIYFTMKLVRGRTLSEVLKDLFLGSRSVRREYTLHKLVSVLERMCEALHFAHEKGVIHRDLKPDNVMLGEYGEVHVMDWGIAKVTDTGEFEDEFGDELDHAVEAAGTEALQTRAGTIKGTIPYMSPEQAAGEELDRRSDVYALGCLLYEILTLHPAFEGDDPMQLLNRVREGEFPPVTGRNPRRPLPEALGDLCTRAMATDPGARPATAHDFGAELRQWLDGRAERARKHREAEALAAEGKSAILRFSSLRAQITEAERAAEAAAGDVKPWQPHEEKSASYDAQERVGALRRDAAVAFADATSLLNAALAAEERNATALRGLADLWADRLAEAERTGAADDVAHALTMIRRYDDGRLADLVQGDGWLELASDPPGAEVTIERLEDRRGVLHPVESRSLGATPVARTTLPMGSYLCVLKKPGFRDVRYPVHISRGRAWRGSVRMLREEEIGEVFVHVPGGPFVYGEGKDTTTKELPDFLIKRTPVTFAEYGEFLAAVEAEDGEEAAAERLPHDNAGTYMERQEDRTYRVKPDIIEGAAAERCLRDFGEDWLGRLPVFGISWHDAVAFCEWKTKVTGREWRLPSEEEREKAARGVDGRRFPWGDAADASLCKCQDSRPEPTQPEPVGAFPSAASVYGMQDAGGGVWDWTSSLWEPLREASTSRVIRGGSWVNPVGAARAALRNRNTPENRNTNFGFRPASSVTT
jgi:serine/threonine-protein kinase